MRAIDAEIDQKATGSPDSFREPFLNLAGFLLLVLLILLLLLVLMLVMSGVGAGSTFYAEAYTDYIPYQISYVYTPQLAQGVREVTQPGRLG